MASSAPTRVFGAGGVDADDEPRAEVRGAGVDRVALAARASAAASPVRTALSSDERPDRTTPSTGTSSPERTSTRSPGASAVSGTSTAGASGPSPVEPAGELEERDAAQAVGALERRALRAALHLPGAEQRRDEHRERVEPDRAAAADDVPGARREGDGERDRDGQVDVDDAGPEGRRAPSGRTGAPRTTSTGTATASESQRKNVSYGEAIPEYSPA